MPQIVERYGRVTHCPACRTPVTFTDIHLWDAPESFLYCDSCPNVLLRRSDNKRLGDLWFGATPETQTSDLVLAFYAELELAAPTCSCGGHFRVKSSARCPHCLKEFPTVTSLSQRAFEHIVIVMDGAVRANLKVHH